ncbi:MAG TPA: NAD(P)/FAD-dependent oxidoreductase [Vitreimonas sp.]|nr:NAD(P)/FAD-dependent oxidoreductase [Vitreimonas sp.]
MSLQEELSPVVQAAPSAPQAAAAPRPRIVIVGAGFGGLECAKALKRADADVVLIDRHNHHTFQPLLYQVATAALAPNDVAWPIREILRHQTNVTTLMANVTDVDLKRRVVRSDAGETPYDFLVLATGATHSYFGHDDWAAVAPGLKDLADARAIRRRLLWSFERAEIETDPQRQQALLTFVIVGGGPTGVELAGAVAEVARQTLRRDFRRIDPRRTRIVLIEAAPRILSAYPESLARYAVRALERKGVDVRLDVRVTACAEEGVETSEGPIAAANIIWAAGVQASPAAAWVDAPRDRNGRVQVGGDLSIAGAPNVFVIGDTAATPEPVPGIAPAAKQMGHYVAKLIKARLHGEPAPAPFRYKHAGDLATIGRNDAVVRFGSLSLTGFPAWAFWSVVHIFFLIGARNRIAVAFNWLWDYITFQRSVRLII